MEVITTISEIRQRVRAVRFAAKSIGLVPTMGALHEGHGSLIRRAVSECDAVIVSIFLNPTQFGPNEDLARYPRPFEADVRYCQKLGVRWVFAPSAEEMYPREQLAWVHVEKVSEGLCGAHRPGHFRGVATVCAKLFNIIQPDVAYFGQKDAQQAVIIQTMVRDLNFPLEIRVCPTVRDKDGLALSSRNQYLSKDERKKALCLSQALEKCRELMQAGCTNPEELRRAVLPFFDQPGVSLEYFELVDPQSLEVLSELRGPVLAAAAARVGSTRLIDNLLIDLQTPAP
jgi:pantoate--beta-alanine ligase